MANKFVGKHVNVVHACEKCSVKMVVGEDGWGTVVKTVESGGHKGHLALGIGDRYPMGKLNGSKVPVTDGESDYQVQL